MGQSSSSAQRVILVVSTGRTGTKAVAHHLNACYEQVLALHEPPPTRFLLRRTANRYLCGQLSHADLVRILATERDKMVSTGAHTIYVESNPGLAGFLDAFGKVFDDFRVVHVIRDPRTYIPSALQWGVFRGMKRVLADYLPFWLPKPDYINPGGELAWRRMTHPERLAWYWQLINRHLDRAESLYPGRYMRMTYEALFARDGSGLASLVDWIGLPPAEKLTLSANSENVNASKPRKGSRWAEWSDADKRAVLRFCAPMMAGYGYDLSADAHLLEPETPAAAPHAQHAA